MGGVRLPQLNAFTSKAAWTYLEQAVEWTSSAACNLEVLFSMRASRKMKVAPCCTFVAHQYLNWYSATGFESKMACFWCFCVF